MKKKTKTIEFRIPEPCAENWNKMHPLPGGRFCDQCEKTLVDFTDMTDNELIRHFENNNKKVCGRFRPDQLNKSMEIPRIPSSFQKWKAVAAVATGLFAWNTTAAQTNPTPVVKGLVTFPLAKDKIERVEQKEGKHSKNAYFKFKGIVKDEKGEPLIGASVLLKKGKGTTTEVDGTFILEIPNDWESFEVTFSYTGFETQVVEFGKNNRNGTVAEIEMKTSFEELGEVVVVGYSVPHIQLSGIVGRVISGEDIPKEIPEGRENEEEKASKEIKEDQLPILNIYPNPFVDDLNVELNLEKEDAYLFHLYNLKGELIWAKTYELPKGKQNLRLDFSLVKMNAGIHFFRITDGKYEIQTKKIIKVETNGGGAEQLISPIRS